MQKLIILAALVAYCLAAPSALTIVEDGRDQLKRPSPINPDIPSDPKPVERITKITDPKEIAKYKRETDTKTQVYPTSQLTPTVPPTQPNDKLHSEGPDSTGHNHHQKRDHQSSNPQTPSQSKIPAVPTKQAAQTAEKPRLSRAADEKKSPVNPQTPSQSKIPAIPTKQAAQTAEKPRLSRAADEKKSPVNPQTPSQSKVPAIPTKQTAQTAEKPRLSRAADDKKSPVNPPSQSKVPTVTTKQTLQTTQTAQKPRQKRDEAAIKSNTNSFSTPLINRDQDKVQTEVNKPVNGFAKPQTLPAFIPNQSDESGEDSDETQHLNKQDQNKKDQVSPVINAPSNGFVEPQTLPALIPASAVPATAHIHAKRDTTVKHQHSEESKEDSKKTEHLNAQDDKRAQASPGESTTSNGFVKPQTLPFQFPASTVPTLPHAANKRDIPVPLTPKHQHSDEASNSKKTDQKLKDDSVEDNNSKEAHSGQKKKPDDDDKVQVEDLSQHVQHKRADSKDSNGSSTPSSTTTKTQTIFRTHPVPVSELFSR